jgi:hypothetical protein
VHGLPNAENLFRKPGPALAFAGCIILLISRPRTGLVVANLGGKNVRNLGSRSEPAQETAGLTGRPGGYSAGRNQSSRRAGLSLPTIKRFEADLRIQVSDRVRQRIQQAFEAAGVVFLDEDGGGLDVRFKRPRRCKQTP